MIAYAYDRWIFVSTSCTLSIMEVVDRQLRLINIVDFSLNEPSSVYAFPDGASYTAVISTYTSMMFIIKNGMAISRISLSCPGFSVANCSMELLDSDDGLYILSGLIKFNLFLGMRDGWVTLHRLDSPVTLDSRHIGSLFPVSLTRFDDGHIVACTDDFTCMISVYRGLMRVEPLDSKVPAGLSSICPFIDGFYLTRMLSIISIKPKLPSSFSDLFAYPIIPEERPLQIAKDAETGLVILTSSARLCACNLKGDILTYLLLPQDGILIFNSIEHGTTLAIWQIKPTKRYICVGSSRGRILILSLKSKFRVLGEYSLVSINQLIQLSASHRF